MAPRKKNDPPRRRSAEAKALALKHFRQRKLPNKKKHFARHLFEVGYTGLSDYRLSYDDNGNEDWVYDPQDGDHGC